MGLFEAVNIALLSQLSISRWHRPQRPELTRADLGVVAPQVIACKIDVLPAQRRQVLQHHVIHWLPMPAQGIRGTLQVHRVPQYDSRRHQVQAAGPVALLLEAAIPDFAQPIEEHRPGQSIAGFTLVQPGVNAAAQLDAWLD